MAQFVETPPRACEVNEPEYEPWVFSGARGGVNGVPTFVIVTGRADVVGRLDIDPAVATPAALNTAPAPIPSRARRLNCVMGTSCHRPCQMNFMANPTFR